MKKALCICLSFILFICMFPVHAAESEFLTFAVEEVLKDGGTTESKAVGYSDGKTLYVPISFFENYMPYAFIDEAYAFVRSGHDVNDKSGRVEFDFDAKKAKLYLTNFESSTYDLENVFNFGEQYFLPLAQIASYLKAAVVVNGTTVRVLNSGYSLADAEYALSVASHSKLLNYDIQNVIDDIYCGSERLFKISGCLGYFGSIVYGLRLDKLDRIANTGDINDYISFLEKCVTDNEGYIRTITENFGIVERFNTAADINTYVHSKSKNLGDVTNVLEELSEPGSNESLDNALMYVNARDWNALFDSIAKVTDFADYYLKLGSMCEDNRKMLDNLKSSNFVSKENAPFYLALTNIWGKYGGDITNKITTKIGEEIVEFCTEEVKELALKEVLPSTEAIKAVATVFKIAGFNLTDNSEYSIMIDLDAKHILCQGYYADEGHMQTKDSTEKYRLSVLLWLISVKQTYIAANQLSKKAEGSPTLYDDEIEKVQALIDLFYVAAQSKNIDSFSGIDNLKSVNEKAIKGSQILSEAEKIPEEEAAKILMQDKEYLADIYKHQYNLNYASFDYDDTYIVKRIASNVDFDGLAIEIQKKSDYSVVSVIDPAGGGGGYNVGIYKGYVYYAGYGVLYRCKVDGSDKTKLLTYKGEMYTDNFNCRFIFFDNKIVVNDAGGNLYLLNLDGSNIETVDVNVCSSLFTYQNYLYYEKDDQLLKMNLNDFSDKEIEIENFKDRDLHSIVGTTLYYLKDYNSPLILKDFIQSVSVSVWMRDLSDTHAQDSILVTCPQNRMWQYQFLIYENVVYAQNYDIDRFGIFERSAFLYDTENSVKQCNIFIGYLDNNIVGYKSFSSELEGLRSFP